MQGDDDLPYSTVDSAHREIVRVLRDRVAGRERPAGQWVVTGDGDRIRVLLPPGYGDVAEELRSRFGERVICEEADVRMRYTERPGDTP
jgi:hypothetical protein